MRCTPQKQIDKVGAGQIIEILHKKICGLGLNVADSKNIDSQDALLLIPSIDYADFNILIGQPPQYLRFGKGMAIASLNVNGLRKHFDEIHNILSSLGIHGLALNQWLSTGVHINPRGL